MSKNNDCNFNELDRQKEGVGDSVTDESLKKKLVVKNKRNYPAKHCLWVDFKAVKLDGRTALAKAINLMRRELIKHVGGKPSIAQALLIERVIHKSMKAFIYETNFFLDQKQGSEDHYLALVNSLRLDLQALGLQRSGGKVGDLAEYLNKKTEKFGRHEEND
jgi:hypothetical protein